MGLEACPYTAPRRIVDGQWVKGRGSCLFGHVAEFEFLDFAGGRLGNLLEDDVARRLVAGEMLPAPGDQLFLRGYRHARLDLDRKSVV